MRKIISIIFMHGLLLSFVISAFATNGTKNTGNENYVSKYTREFNILNALKIMEIDSSETYDGSIELTRAEAASIVTRMLGIVEFETTEETGFYDVNSLDVYAANIITVKNMGIMTGQNGYFEPDASITYEQFVKVLVDTLGYQELAKLKGGYPSGYLSVASQLGILNGLSMDWSEALRRDLVAHMVYNSLDAPVLVQYKFGDNDEYTKSSANTILSEYLDVYKDIGIIKGTEKTLLSGESNLSKGQMVINDIIFEKGSTDVDAFLGYNVIYYYKDNGDGENGTLLYIDGTSKNNIIEIQSSDIDDFRNNTYYYSNEKGTSKTVSISKRTDIIYNGKRASDKFNRFIPTSGKIVMIDNDMNGNYDVLIITDYKLYQVGTIDIANMIIYDNHKSANMINLGDSKVRYKIIDSVGQELEFIMLSVNDILSVTSSEDKTVIYMYLSKKTVTGTIAEIGDYEDETAIKIDDTLYCVNKQYDSLFDGEVGDVGIFYLDIDGKIAAFKKDSLSNINIAYIINAQVKDDIEKRLMFKMLKSDGNIEILYGRKNLKLESNGVEIKNENGGSLSSQELMEKLSVNGAFKPQIAIYLKNSNGEINSIEVAAPYTDDLKVELKGLQQTWTGNTKYHTIFQTFSGRVILSNDALVFNIPADLENDKDYSVGTKVVLKNSDSYSFTSYKTSSDTLYSNIIVGNNLGGAGKVDINRMMLVSSISKSVNIDGEDCYGIRGLVKGQKVTLFTENMEVLDDWGVEPGDLIVFGTDDNNVIKNMQKNFDESTRKIYISDIPTTTASENPTRTYYDGLEYRYLYGGVYQKLDNVISIHKNSASNPDFIAATRNNLETLDANKVSYVYIFDKNKTGSQSVSLGTLGDIYDYKNFGTNFSNIVVNHTDWGRYATVIIYK